MLRLGSHHAQIVALAMRNYGKDQPWCVHDITYVTLIYFAAFFTLSAAPLTPSFASSALPYTCFQQKGRPVSLH